MWNLKYRENSTHKFTKFEGTRDEVLNRILLVMGNTKEMTLKLRWVDDNAKK
jgi:hypothetical protein